MNDLEKGKHVEKSELVNLWLKDVKDVACSAENLLDDYQYEMLRRKIEFKTNRPSFKKKCGNYMKPSTNPIVFRIRMTHRVNQILSELDELERTAINMGLQQVQLAWDAVSPFRSAGRHTDHMDSLSQARKHAAATESHFIGREHDKEELLQRILNPSTKEDGLSIIAIVGIGGLGKTTLARQLYEHEKVNEQFARKKPWICVSEDFHVNKILKEMVEALQSTKCDLTNMGAIIDNLQAELKGKKFFLVLDDVWNDKQELWESLKTELQRIGGLPGSVILITTRSHEVANRACASYTHELKGLSETDGWDLLKRQVFYDKTFPYDPSYDEVGKRIVVEKCKGVPLAIKSIGSLLQSKQHESEWISIENSELWNIKADDKSYLMPSLLLSYNHINPANVRQCFAYCAIFPKDSVMEKGNLIALWLSQGLIRNEFETGNSSATHEASGEKCFDILVNHSFLQKENNDDYQAGYKMHDLVHDLATYVLMKELLVWNTKDKIDVVDSQVRHLVFDLKDDDIAPETLAKEKMRKLRTISFWKGAPRWNSLICAQNVRTLVMVDVGLIEVPSVIGQLVHLRYLDLSENDEVKALPESLCKLYQLQTLRLLWCNWLEELPKKLNRLRNLRHIETSHPVYASTGLQTLTCLQTLPLLELRDGEGWTIDELGPLDQVKGDVCISGLEFVKNKEEAKGASLRRKDKIMKLVLSWGESSKGHNDEVVLDGLEPHPNIESLGIYNFGGVKFPRWIMTMNVGQSEHRTQLCYLTEVKLSHCTWCKQLPSLGQLSKLRSLRLSGFDKVGSIGEEFYENDINIGDTKVLFPELRELYFDSFKSVTTWMPPSSTPGVRSCFPNLETLKIKSCPQLEKVPSVPLKSLGHLELWNVGLNSIKVVGKNEMVGQPGELLNCVSLKTLTVSGCEKVKRIHIEDATKLSHLTEVRLTDCKVCKELPSLGQLPNLTILKLKGFDKVKCIGDEFYYENSSNISDGIVLFPALRELCIEGFRSLTTWMPPSSAVGTSVLPKLETLAIGRCIRLETVPALHLEYLKDVKVDYVGGDQVLDIIKGSPSPNSLHVEGVDEMVSLPKELSNCISLQRLGIEKCKKVEWIPGGMISLKQLWVWSCPSLGSIEDGVLHGLSSLRELVISRCRELKRVPKSLEDCTSLEELTIEDCPLIDCPEEEAVPDISKLQRLTRLTLSKAGGLMAYSPRWIPQLHGLEGLYIGGWGEVGLWDMSLTRTLSSLKGLRLTSFSNLKALVAEPEQPIQHLLPPSLQSLWIDGFEEMEALPEWIGYLSSLQELRLWDCKKLKYLPSAEAMKRLTRLTTFRVDNSPKLEETERSKISHLH